MPWAVPAIAVVILCFAAVSRLLEGTVVTAPIVFTAAGLLLGASMLDVVHTDPNHESVKLLAESSLALMLFGDAARINLRALRDEFRLPARLLGIGLPLTIALGFAVALLLFGSLGWPEALLLAVVVAPTDAALGQAVVTLPSLPSRIRQGLNVESGLNDGLCVPVFVTVLAVASTEAGLVGREACHPAPRRADRVRHALRRNRRRARRGGDRAGRVARLCRRFVAPAGARGRGGALLHGCRGRRRVRLHRRVRGRLRLRSAPAPDRRRSQLLARGGRRAPGAATFVVFGAVLLEPSLSDVTWAVAAYAALSLTLIRMLPVALSLIGTHARRPTVAFLGWFGPRGLASIVFAILLIEPSGDLPHEHVVLTTVFTTIGLSILAHGVTAAPLARRYSAWYAAHPRPARVESGEVPEVRWRVPQSPPA